MNALVQQTDAELIAACAEFDRLERQILQVEGAATTVEREYEADRLTATWKERQETLVLTISSARASTLAGLQAKTATLVLWDSEALSPSSDYWNERLVTSLLGDLLGFDATHRENAKAARDALIAGTFTIGNVGAAA